MSDGFVVPNAPDASVFDQAEPDSLDFLVVGNRRSGVAEGGAVTPLNASSVNVEAVSVVSSGVAGSVAAGAVNVPAADAANARFDVVIVRRNTADNTFSVLTISGPTNLTTNPRFPAVGTAAGEFNPLTDVLLAAIYRAPGTSVQDGDIVDKRIFLGGVITRKGSATPPVSLGREGEVYYWTGSRSRGQSSFFIKTADGWQNLMEFDPSIFVPIGTVITYGGRTGRSPDSSYYMECLGQYVSVAAYPDLYDEIGDSFGPVVDGQFRLPQMQNRYARGASAAGVGAGQVSHKLTKDNLPLLELAGSTGSAGSTTTPVTRPALGHTVGGVSKNHGHLMEHEHRGQVFVYPFGTYQNPDTGGQPTRSYYHLYESPCSGSHGQPGLHLGIVDNTWANPGQAQHGDRWQEYLMNETREYTSGIHPGTIPVPTYDPGSSFESGDHVHAVTAHPSWTHQHNVAAHQHSITLPSQGKLDNDPIPLDPPHTNFRHFIKYR